jgi:hypothetical protein
MLQTSTDTRGACPVGLYRLVEAIQQFDSIRDDGISVAFKPELCWIVVAAAALSLLLAIAVAGMLSVSPSDWWGYIGFGAIAAYSMWVLMRIWNVGVSYDATHLSVTGVLWSRRIPRRSITAVDRDPASASVTWRGRSGGPRVTPLTAVWGNRWGWLPEAGRKRRVEFLRRVARWART